MRNSSNLALTVLLMAAVACTKNEPPDEKRPAAPPLTAAEETEIREQAASIFGVLPDVMPGAENDNAAMVSLGKTLYSDVRLSVNDKQSCNTCHNVNDGGAGVDNEPTSEGAFGKRGARNSPTVFNAGYHFVQFWDGRADDLVAQAKGPILNPVEMAMPSAREVERKLRGIEEYQTMFAAAFPNARQPITYDNTARAIAAFERTLRRTSRYDEWVGGTQDALTTEEKRGLKEFVEAGCIACHTGPLFGGSMYQKLGLVHPYASNDAGRFEVTKDPSDSLMFKVPSLRLVGSTQPYFHDGSVKSLNEAVRLMAWHQLGKKLSDSSVASIEAFLKAL